MGTTSLNTPIVSRRRLAQGVAWAVPVVAVAAAAPAYAASGPVPSFVYLGACKFSGQSCSRASFGYAFAFNVTNNDPARTVYICNVQMINKVGTNLNFTWSAPGGGCLTLAPGSSGTAYLYFGSANSGNQNFTCQLQMAWGHTCPCSGDPDPHPPIVTGTLNVASTPPGGICLCGADFIPA